MTSRSTSATAAPTDRSTPWRVDYEYEYALLPVVQSENCHSCEDDEEDGEGDDDQFATGGGGGGELTSLIITRVEQQIKQQQQRGAATPSSSTASSDLSIGPEEEEVVTFDDSQQLSPSFSSSSSTTSPSPLNNVECHRCAFLLQKWLECDALLTAATSSSQNPPTPPSSSQQNDLKCVSPACLARCELSWLSPRYEALKRQLREERETFSRKCKLLIEEKISILNQLLKKNSEIKTERRVLLADMRRMEDENLKLRRELVAIKAQTKRSRQEEIEIGPPRQTLTPNRTSCDYREPGTKRSGEKKNKNFSANEGDVLIASSTTLEASQGGTTNPSQLSSSPRRGTLLPSLYFHGCIACLQRQQVQQQQQQLLVAENAIASSSQESGSVHTTSGNNLRFLSLSPRLPEK